MEAQKLFDDIRKAWTKETAYPGLQDQWTPDLPEKGQCAITALLIQENFGGFVVFNKKYHHYWNILQDVGEVDLTKNQFGIIDHMKIDGYRDTSYFTKNEDTVKRYNLLKANLKKIQDEKIRSNS